MLSEVFSTLKHLGRSSSLAPECQPEKALTKSGLTSKKATVSCGQMPRDGKLSPLVQGEEAGVLRGGESQGTPEMLAVPRELGHCVRWRRCPDARLGVALAPPARLPAAAQEPGTASQG